MITNDEELAVIRQQLARCERAIESLQKELLPHNERNFNLYAGPWLDFRDQFQSDIDAYLRAKIVPANGPTGIAEPTKPKALEPAGGDRGGDQNT